MKKLSLAWSWLPLTNLTWPVGKRVFGTIIHSSWRLFLWEYSFQSTIDKFQRIKTIFHSSQHSNCVNFILVTSKHSQNLTPAHSCHSGPGPGHHHHLVPVLPPPSSRSPCFCRGLLTLTVNTGATRLAPGLLFSKPSNDLLSKAFTKASGLCSSHPLFGTHRHSPTSGIWACRAPPT